MGKNDDGSDSMAVQLVDESHWDDLVIIIAVSVQSRRKPVAPVGCGTLLKQAPSCSTGPRLTCADSNQFHVVCLDTSPPMFYMNDTPHRIISLVEKWNHSEGTPHVYSVPV
ncbi:unnamed protein product [Triticum turgidum subsp. durum]|uniref:Mvd1 C-terminal domain-containing protein n=1 Tax=Triticum turgidum subsp. durum TaxID=4567 RepID=A0A9R1BK28_TRITD|nr:unnamed protein product [Triticum turgidum subsp. durum]